MNKFQAQSPKVLSIVILLACFVGCQKIPVSQDSKANNKHANSIQSNEKDKPGADKIRNRERGPYSRWLPMFTGPFLKKWDSIDFGTTNDHEIRSQMIRVNNSYELSGVRYTGDDLPTNNYKIQFNAQKAIGTDFFCCLTFPVHDQFCSFVVGGWGGTVTGISCVDRKDASDNPTTTIRKYNKTQVYKIRVEVTDDKLQCWIDDEKVVDLSLDGVELSLRTDVEQCKPFSLCSFATSAIWSDMVIEILDQ